MKKVLLIISKDPERPSFEYQCKKAFQKLGFKVDYFNYRMFQFHRFEITNKLLNKILYQKALNSNPDLIFTIKGETIEKGIIEKLSSKGIKTANWTLDEPFGIYSRFTKIGNIPEYDYFFIFDPYYIEKLKQKGAQEVHYIPCAADPEIHKEMIPIEKREHVTDVGFLGSFQPKREKILKNLTDYNLKIGGYNWRKAKDKKLKKRIQNRVYTGSMMNKYFNLSKININIHHPHSKESVNLRTFEIPATNSFMLCDYFKEIPNLFKLNKEIVCYHNIKELRELINYYLENEDERIKIAKAGQKRVLKEHKVIDRIKQMLKIIQI